MKKVIYRNIAIVSAIFIVSFSIMLITNYFQVRGSTPLGVEVLELLKQLNNENADNSELQVQIRELDLIARKAYFVQHDRLVSGVYIMLIMLAVFFYCARGYFEGHRDIPDKEIDPVDDWAIKTKARKYVVFGTSGLAATALVFVVITSPHLRASRTSEIAEYTETLNSTKYEDDASSALHDYGVSTLDTSDTETETEDADDADASLPASRVNHNSLRGHNSNGHSAARNIPVRWNLSSGANIAWRKEIPRIGYSSPVINSNKVFITGGDAVARELYCYDLNTGNLLWTLAANNISGSPANVPEVYDDYMVAASTVATNGTYVCAIFATGDIICADMDGNRIWARNLGVPSNSTYGYASSPIMFGNMLYVQYDVPNNARLMALDIATGAERWSRSRADRESWASPMIAYTSNNTPILVIMGNPAVTAYNPNNGEQLWRHQFTTGDVSASAGSSNGIVYVASDYSKLLAINAADGTILWDDNFFLPEMASPVATRDNVYIATGYGVFAAYDTQTGELRKEHDLDGMFWSSPMIVDGKIFLFNSDGKMYIFSTDNEFRLLDSFDTGEKTSATPAFTDGRIVVRTETSIYSVVNN